MNRTAFISGLIVAIIIMISIALLVFWKKYTRDASYTLAYIEASLICRSIQKIEDCETDKLQLEGHKPYDPWGNPYLCKIANNEFIITSFGKNGRQKNSHEAGVIVCRKKILENSDDRIRCECVVE